MKKSILLAISAVILTVGVATAQPDFFTEDFSGTTLDPAWTQVGDAGHLGLTGTGLYLMTDPYGREGTKLRRSVGGPPHSFDHTIALQLDPFTTVGNPPDNTKTDFKFRAAGRDGFVEIVINSFGNMRLYHKSYVDGYGGNLVNNATIGYTDGDVLQLRISYDQTTDTLSASYSLNGGAAVPFYLGNGINGSFGDIITEFVQVEMFKFDSTPTDQAFASIDSWALVSSTDPEPSAVVRWHVGAALEKKLAAFELVVSAQEEEQLAYDQLEKMLMSGEYGPQEKGDIVKAKQKIHGSMQHEDAAAHHLVTGMKFLEEVLDKLDDELDESPNLAGRIHSLKQQPDGKMRLEFQGEAGQSYVIEGSTNLVDWKPICVVRPDEEGNCGYEDVEAAKHQSRFYRVVKP